MHMVQVAASASQVAQLAKVQASGASAVPFLYPGEAVTQAPVVVQVAHPVEQAAHAGVESMKYPSAHNLQLAAARLAPEGKS